MAEAMQQGVDKIEFIVHKGHRVMVATNNHFDPVSTVAAIDRLAAAMEKEADGGLRVVLEVSQGRVSNEGTARWKHCLPVFERKVLRGAVVAHSLRRIIASMVLMAANTMGMGLAGRVKICATLEEGLEYVGEA